MQINSHNFGIAYGALVNDPKIRTNANKSHGVLITVAIHGFNNSVQYLDFQRYVPEQSKALLANFSKAKKGDLVYINYHPQKQSYKKSGKMIYKTQLLIDQITFLNVRYTNNNSDVQPSSSVENNDQVDIMNLLQKSQTNDSTKQSSDADTTKTDNLPF